MVIPSLGQDLKARRTAAGFTQDAAAKRLGVSRPTLTQWEADRHRPSPEHLDRLDALYGARGELIRFAIGGHPSRQDEPSRRLYVADVFRDVADALVAALVKENGRPQGWSRNLTDGTATPLSTAYVIRTLQLLDDARVDLHRIADIFDNPSGEYSYYHENRQPRPEVTSFVLSTLARMGRLSDADTRLNKLKEGLEFDQFALHRPFILAVVLEAVLAIRPDSELAHYATKALLDSRSDYGEYTLWTMNAAAPAARTSPSLAHTARATAILRIAQSTTRYRSEVGEAIDMAIEWMRDLNTSDAGAIEMLDRTENTPTTLIHHFTSAWVIRSLTGVQGVPGSRIQAAVDILWGSYSLEDRLWIWRDDGSVPSVMTLEAVSALRVLADASLTTPLPPN